MRRAITAIQFIMFILIIGFLGGYENGGTFREFITYSSVPLAVMILGQVIKKIGEIIIVHKTNKAEKLIYMSVLRKAYNHAQD